MHKSSLAAVFEGQMEDEIIRHVFTKHWLTDIPEMLMFLLLFVVPFVLLLTSLFSLSGMSLALLWIFSSYYFVLFLTALFIHWLNDFFDIFILTDKRLIDITQERFLVRKTSVAELNQIQHASYTQKGLVDTILNIGVVDVQTAGNKPDLTLEDIVSPSKVTDTILTYSRQYKKQVSVEVEKQLAEEAAMGPTESP